MAEITTRLSTALAGRYKIDKRLGEGGMATVYLAEDLKHKRKVAVKVLRPELAAVLGAERFVQEITTTASLQHPHILPLFDSGEADGFLYYVMPYIEGETLRSKLDRETQFGIDEAVKITTEVADALDYAHRQNVIHRDIKPENILLHDGRPMVADFGIALAVSAAAGGRMTETGLSLGTPHYMSPEQATAEKDLTSRSDIYSLGSMLYEMLTGEPPHTGGSAQAIIMKIVTEPAQPVTQIRRSVPPNVAAATAKALERLAADRFSSAAKFAEALASPSFTVPMTHITPADAPAGARRPRLVPGIAIAAAVVGAVGGYVVRGVTSARTPLASTSRFTIELPATSPVAPADLSAVAISPNGRRIIYVGEMASGTQLYMRGLNSLHIDPIGGTESAMGPFFSPDGEWVGFFASGKLKKVRVDGGTPETLADAALARGAAWGPNDTIYFTSAPGTGLWAVHANGGTAHQITRLDTTVEERTHRLPQAVPDGRFVLFTSRAGTHATFDGARIERFDLDAYTRELIFDGGSHGRVLPSGELVFVREGTLYGIDLSQPAAAPVAVLDSVMTDPSTGAAHYSFSREGTLVYVRGAAWVPRRQLVRIHSGQSATLSSVTGPFRSPRFAPDGWSIAVVTEAANDDIWIHDLRQGGSQQLTFERGSNIAPEWAPDGSRVVFSSNRDGRYNLYIKAADGSGTTERVTESDDIQFASSWHPDGSSIVFTQTTEATGADIWLVSLDGGDPQPLLQGLYNESSGVIAPFGTWIAYVSDETGRNEVYAQRYPEGSGKRRISTDGGFHPRWAKDGSRLFYRRGREMVEVTVELLPEFRTSPPTIAAMFPLQGVTVTSVADYDVAPGGMGFLVIEEEEVRAPDQIHIVLDWIAEVQARLRR